MHFTDEQLEYISENLLEGDNSENRIWNAITNKVAIELCKRANKKRLEEETE